MGQFADMFSVAWRKYVINDVPSSGAHKPLKDDIIPIGQALDEAIESAAAGEVLMPTWSALAAIVGTRAGQKGVVPGTDAGTHDDPVTGSAGVPNSGIYSWSVSPAGWERVSDYVDALAIDVRAIAAYNNAQLSVASSRIAQDGTTYTISWTTARATFAGASAAVVTIADVTDLAIASTEHLYIDLTTGGLSYSVSKATTSPSLRADFAAGRKLMLLYNNFGTLMGPMYGAMVNPLLLDRVSWDADEMVVAVKPTLDQIDVWQKANPHPVNSSYIRWRFPHFTQAGNYDVWRLCGVYDETRLDRFAFTQVRRIASEGEYETAIQETGKPDFMGGSVHGDEVLTSAHLFIDGVLRTTEPASTSWYRARSVMFIQESTLYEVGTSLGTTRATVLKRWEWRNGEMILSQRVEWAAAVSINGAFQVMLPIERVQYNNPSFQITSGAIRSPDWTIIDVSAADHATPDTDSGHILIYGGTSGYSAEVEVLAGWERVNRRSQIEDVAEYNKLRFDVTGSSYTTAPGEVWETVARYRLSKATAASG